MEPGVEAIDVAQGGQVPPASDERLLDGVLGPVGSSKDESRGGVQSADRGACQHGEGVMIALPRPLHEVSLHVRPRPARPVWSRLESIGRIRRKLGPIGSYGR